METTQMLNRRLIQTIFMAYSAAALAACRVRIGALGSRPVRASEAGD
jgi:hypothetical protein